LFADAIVGISWRSKVVPKRTNPDSGGAGGGHLANEVLQSIATEAAATVLTLPVQTRLNGATLHAAPFQDFERQAASQPTESRHHNNTAVRKRVDSEAAASPMTGGSTISASCETFYNTPPRTKYRRFLEDKLTVDRYLARTTLLVVDEPARGRSVLENEVRKLGVTTHLSARQRTSI
jgi:hypothetical protein